MFQLQNINGREAVVRTEIGDDYFTKSDSSFKITEPIEFLPVQEEKHIVYVQPAEYQPKPTYIIKTRPKTKIIRLQREEIVEEIEPEEQPYRIKCCKSVYETDEYQWFDCTNGRCFGRIKCMAAMWYCPVWFWTLMVLSLMSLILPIIYIALNTSFKFTLITRYVYGANTYYQKYNDTYYIYLVDAPCGNYTFDNFTLYNDTNSTTNATNMTTFMTTTIIPCNLTTTRLYSSKYKYSGGGSVTYGITSGAIPRRILIYKIWFILNSISIIGLYMNYFK